MGISKDYKIETRRFVKDVLSSNGLSQLPINVEEVAKHAGLKIVEFPFQEDISGVLVVDENGATIGYNAKESPVRKRFSIAHELGHYILHMEQNASGVFMDKLLFRKNITNYSSTEEAIEREANYFAANLLMPEDLVIREVNHLNPSKDDEENIKALAKIFGVSISAMTYRLVNLGFYKMGFAG